MDLKSFDVSPTCGFLPEPDPLVSLGNFFAPLEEIGQNLPKLLSANRFRKEVNQLPLLDLGKLKSPAEWRRAMMLYSYLGHAFIWEDWRQQPENFIPKNIAVPWHQIAKRLGRPPILSYESYALDNWRRMNPADPIQLGNIALLQNFLGGLDEEWFILVHVEIEAEAAPALASIGPAQEAMKNNTDQLVTFLQTIATSQGRMYETLLRMTENCDPYIYYNRVRPYIHGFVYHPVVYEGVEEYRGQPQKFFGETGAQSSIVPTLDAFFGIEHADDPLKSYLVQMKDYMPTKHQAFIAAAKEGVSVRDYVAKHRGTLLGAYNECVNWLRMFRSKHVEYAENYIEKQAETSPHNPTHYGTGGTPFIRYLKKHRDETLGLS